MRRFFRDRFATVQDQKWAKATAVIMFLTLMTIAGVILMVEVYKHATPSGLNSTTTAHVANYPFFTAQALTSASTLVTSFPIATNSDRISVRLKPQAHEDPSGGDMTSIPTNAGEPSSISVTSTSVTPVEATASPGDMNSVMGSTFKTIFTTATILSGDLPALASPKDKHPALIPAQPSLFRNARVHWTGRSAMVTAIYPDFATPGFYVTIATDVETAVISISTTEQNTVSSEFPRQPFSPESWLSLASTMHSEEGVQPTPTADSTNEAAQDTMTSGAAASTSLAMDTTISASIDPNPIYTDGPPLSAPATLVAASSTKIPPSVLFSTDDSTITSTTQDLPGANSESNIPDYEKGNPLFPWTQSQDLPSTLTGTATILNTTPTQGVPSTPLAPVVSSISSSVASVLATASLTSVSITGSSFSAPTHIQSVPPTSAPTSAPSSGDSKKRLSIGLGVCIPIIALALGFIVLWLYIRHVEKKKKDDLEKEIIWITPRPTTPNANSTLMTGIEDAGSKKIEGRRASAPMNPLAMNPLNEEELAIARQYGLALDAAKAQRDGDTSARSPRKTIQRRSGGSNLTRQWIDGTNDSPPSNNGNTIDPFHDRNAIGLAVTTNDCYRDELYRFQPTRLSTITDKSGEVEMPAVVATYGGAGSGRINQGGIARGRFFERLLMKRKGMMPLEG